MAKRQQGDGTWLTCREAAEIAGLNVQTIRRWIQIGKLPVVRRNIRHQRIHTDDLRKALAVEVFNGY